MLPDSMQPGLSNAIIQTVAYADIFDFPVTAEEIHRYLIGVNSCLEETSTTLARDKKLACQLSSRDDYYMLPGRESIVEIRRQRSAAAARLWPHALRFGRLIANLPYVRMLAVTGSLAVDNVTPRADIDYMVITANDRLWLVRAQIILLVRLAWRLHRIVLCPNFLVTERALVLPDRSLYAARELAQIVPLSGLDVYRRLRQANAWTCRFLPNAAGPPSSALPPFRGRSWPKRLGETILQSSMGGQLERWERNRKIPRLTRNQLSSAESKFTADWCKGHFQEHGKRVLDAFLDRTEPVPVPHPLD